MSLIMIIMYIYKMTMTCYHIIFMIIFIQYTYTHIWMTARPFFLHLLSVSSWAKFVRWSKWENIHVNDYYIHIHTYIIYIQSWLNEHVVILITYIHIYSCGCCCCCRFLGAIALQTNFSTLYFYGMHLFIYKT